MGKARSDSKLDSLPPNQRECLEGWLLDENLSIDQAVDRLRLDFAVCSSRSAVGRFSQNASQRRLLEGIARSASAANVVEAKFRENPSDMYAVILQRIGQIAFEQSISSKEIDPEILYNYTKLLIAGKKEQLRGEMIALQRSRFEFDAAAACLKKLPELKAIASDSKLDQDAKLRQVRLKLFGVLPGEEDI